MEEPVSPTEALEGDPPVAITAQAALDRAQLAEIAVERTRMPMVITDPRRPDNPIVLANTAFIELTGYSAEELLGRNCRLLQGAGTSRESVEAIRQGLADQRDVHVEILNYRKDGSAFWNQLNISPIYDQSGQLVYFFASQIDVTVFRKVQLLEASEHRLLREVDHRALNVLAIVNGIVRLSRAEDSERYAKAIQQRVQALANAHSLLANRGWKGVDLAEVISQQIVGVHTGRVTVAGPPVKLSAFVVQPLSLVLHELLDNAKLYGALVQPAGGIDITWSKIPSSGGFSLWWREYGCDQPAKPAEAGFGSAMLTGMIERQLRGTVSREWTNDGLTIVILVPGSLEALAEG